MMEEDAEKSMRVLGQFNHCMFGVAHLSGETPSERHPAGDELLYVLEGEVDVTTLTDSEPARETVCSGSVFVVPNGLWHRQFAQPEAKLLFITPSEGNEDSWADHPRDDGST
jgi:quercetin dioxygenase-like cupin family protein